MRQPQPFRVTLWFKKGELDAELAGIAAKEGDDLHPGAVDLLPAEDRYIDDGSVTGEDSRVFGLHTGETRALPRICDPVALPPTQASIDLLVRDAKPGHVRLVVAAVAAAATAVILAFAF
jgi:hypothetical protein